MMTRSIRWVVLASLALTSSLAFAQEEQEKEAGDTSSIDRDVGPLKGRIPPVSGHFFLHKGRFELTPSVGLSFNDPFFTKYFLTLSLTYHISETFGLVLHGGYGITAVSNAAQICTNQTCRPPDLDKELKGNAPGYITLLAGLDAQWAPIYGKIALLAETFVHFDLYGILGPTAIQYHKADLSTGALTWTVGGDVGLGMHFFITKWLTLRAEVKDVIYVEQVPALTQSPNSLRNQLVFDVGVSFFFPTNFDEG